MLNKQSFIPKPAARRAAEEKAICYRESKITYPTELKPYVLPFDLGVIYPVPSRYGRFTPREDAVLALNNARADIAEIITKARAFLSATKMEAGVAPVEDLYSCAAHGSDDFELLMALCGVDLTKIPEESDDEYTVYSSYLARSDFTGCEVLGISDEDITVYKAVDADHYFATVDLLPECYIEISSGLFGGNLRHKVIHEGAGSFGPVVCLDDAKAIANAIGFPENFIVY